MPFFAYFCADFGWSVPTHNPPSRAHHKASAMKQTKKRTIDIQFVTACISTSLVLLLLGAVVLVVLSANSLSEHVRENLELSLLLNDNAEKTGVDHIVRHVEAQHYTKEVRYISKEDILTEQTASLGLDPTEFLGYNPYTASIEIKLKADYANTDSLSKIVGRLDADEDVMGVDMRPYVLEGGSIDNNHVGKSGTLYASYSGNAEDFRDNRA